MADATWEGMERTIEKLMELKDKTATKIAKAVVNAAAGAMVKDIRSNINSSNASPELKKAARKLVNKRMMKKEGMPTTAKVGFSVGKFGQTVREKRARSAHERYIRGQGGTRGLEGQRKVAGVGISRRNVSWFVILMKQRTTKAGVNRGKVEAILADAVKATLSRAGDAMTTAGIAKMDAILAKEFSK